MLFMPITICLHYDKMKCISESCVHKLVIMKYEEINAYDRWYSVTWLFGRCWISNSLINDVECANAC